MFRIAIQVLDLILLNMQPTQQNKMNKSKHIMQTTEECDSNGISNNNNISIVEILKVKVKAQLALAHIYSEMKYVIFLHYSYYFLLSHFHVHIVISMYILSFIKHIILYHT